MNKKRKKHVEETGPEQLSASWLFLWRKQHKVYVSCSSWRVHFHLPSSVLLSAVVPAYLNGRPAHLCASKMVQQVKDRTAEFHYTKPHPEHHLRKTLFRRVKYSKHSPSITTRRGVLDLWARVASTTLTFAPCKMLMALDPPGSGKQSFTRASSRNSAPWEHDHHLQCLT